MSPDTPAPTSRSHRRRRVVNLCVAALVFVALVVSLASLALAANGFPDVPSHHPYYEAIGDLSSRGIINGYTNGDFGPEDPVTRQQFAKMIVGTGDYPVSEDDICPFDDVVVGGADTFYPDNFVAVCAAKGITTGKTATTFDPGAKITRYQVVSMVVRAARDLDPNLLPAPPTGWTPPAGWGSDPTHGANATRAVYGGLLDGLDLEILSPYSNMSRGEVAQVLHNLLLLLGSPPPLSSSTTTTTYSTTSSSTSSTSTTTTTQPQQVGDLIHFWWMTSQDWMAENVSAATGRKIAGSPVGWADYATSGNPTLRIAAPGTDDDLLLFSQAAGASWQAQNLSQSTGQKVSGHLATWTSGESFTTETEHLAATSPSGDLLHFWQEPGAGFVVDNVTARTDGPKIAGEVAPLLYGTSSGGLEHLVAQSVTGDLIIYWDHPLQHDWQWANISSTTGHKITGSPVTWGRYVLVQGGQDPYFELNIAAVGEDGALLHFTGRAGAAWQVESITAQLGRTVQDGVVAWSTFNMPIVGSHNIAGIGPDGHLLRFWNTGSNWLVEDVSTATGVNAVGQLSYYVDYVSPSPQDSKWYDHLVANSPSGDVLIWWDELLKHNWKAVDVTQKTGQRVLAPLSTWKSFFGTELTPVNHLAGLRPD